MSHIKKVISGFKFVKSENKSVPEIYTLQKRNKLLEQGYKEMASFNLSLAEMCLETDNEALSVCEEKLTECE